MATHEMIAPRVLDHPSRKIDFSGLHSPGLFAKWPIIGLIMFIFGSLVFGGLTYNLQAHGPLLEWDKVIANTLPAIALKGPAFLQGIMDGGFYLGKEGIAVLSVLIGIYLIIKRCWQEFAMLAIAMIGASALFLFLSGFIDRARPPTQIWIVLTIPGFPSGHAVSSVVFFGLLAYLLVPKMASAFWKGFVIVAALLIISFIGFSRIFTGGHYLTDVLSGYAVGIAWSGLAFTLIEIIFQKIRSHNVKKE